MEKCNIDFKNLFIKVYPEVYEPAEDSYQLLESIDIKEGQDQDKFIDDLKMLEEIWREKLDTSNEY